MNSFHLIDECASTESGRDLCCRNLTKQELFRHSKEYYFVQLLLFSSCDSNKKDFVELHYLEQARCLNQTQLAISSIFSFAFREMVSSATSSMLMRSEQMKRKRSSESKRLA